MSKPKYKQGKQICSISDYEKSDCSFFKVKFGNEFKTEHRAFLMSLQYRLLKTYIERGWVFEAERIEDAKLQTTVCQTEPTKETIVKAESEVKQ